MGKRVKVSDLEITERTPILVYVSQNIPSWRDSPLPVLHICKRLGTVKGELGGRYSVTDCGRPLRYDHTFSDKSLAPTEFRLCSRCGTQVDFKQALADYHQEHKEWLKRDAQRTQEKEARRHQEYNEKADRLLEFVEVAITDNVETQYLGNPMYALRIEHNGHTYEIKEVQEKGR